MGHRDQLLDVETTLFQSRCLVYDCSRCWILRRLYVARKVPSFLGSGNLFLPDLFLSCNPLTLRTRFSTIPSDKYLGYECLSLSIRIPMKSERNCESHKGYESQLVLLRVSGRNLRKLVAFQIQFWFPYNPYFTNICSSYFMCITVL